MSRNDLDTARCCSTKSHVASGKRDRFAVDDLYRWVINRNNRLAWLHELNARETILRNELGEL